MSRDLTNPVERIRYARSRPYGYQLRPRSEHLTLLRRACWDWTEQEFGAATINEKRPYGNGDVLADLAEILPDLGEQECLRAHCELHAVLAWICAHLPDTPAESGATP